jgi:hypothetical protein
MILFILIAILFVIGFYIYDYWNTGRVLRESHHRILGKINEIFDGVKSFLTVTFIDRFFSAAESELDDDAEILDDTNTDL